MTIFIVLFLILFYKNIFWGVFWQSSDQKGQITGLTGRPRERDEDVTLKQGASHCKWQRPEKTLCPALFCLYGVLPDRSGMVRETGKFSFH